MVDTIKFSQMTDGGDIDNGKKTPGLAGGANVLFNNPWTFLKPGTTATRPAPDPEMYNRLRFNTDDQIYEYYDSVAMIWTQLAESSSIFGPILTYEADITIPDAQNLGLLGSGILKQATVANVATLNIAVNGTDYWAPGDALTRTQAPSVGSDVTNKTYVDSLIATSFTSINIQAFATSGTYTPSAGMIYCIVELVGAGGGGGGAAGGAGETGFGGSGASGAYSKSVLSAASIGASQAVTIGAAGTAGASGNHTGGTGGNTSLGALVIANGGAGGQGSASTATTLSNAGGLPPGVGTGQISSGGQYGGYSAVVDGVNGIGFGTPGGSTLFGSGGITYNTNMPLAANGYGSGGGGGVGFNGTASVGGAGTSGYVVITEYI